MTVQQLYDELLTWGKAFKDMYPEGETCDVRKCGSFDAEVTKVATTMHATVEVLQKAQAMGAQLLIVHEPMYYNHYDTQLPNFIAQEKHAIAEASGLTIFRFHDYAHAMKPDLIDYGVMKKANLPGKFEMTNEFGVNFFELQEPMTARELAAHMEKALGFPHIRIAGAADWKGKRLQVCFGAIGDEAVIDGLKKADFVLTGEVCEWQTAEAVRDYAQMHGEKALLVLGHLCSERAGMEYLAELINEAHPELHAEYIESGNVYSYAE